MNQPVDHQSSSSQNPASAQKIAQPVLSSSLLFLVIVWTLLVAGLAIYHYQRDFSYALNMSILEARASFNKDLAYRRWASIHGGVYVPVTNETPPNAYLKNIPEQNITTPSGKRLTLMNPAYMTRQVHEMAQDLYGLRGHITSLNPLRPENEPDEWEKQALQQFSGANQEIAEISPIHGVTYFRFMKPMITEQSCLKCHADQGYKEGDIRGGISVSIPWEPKQEILNEQFYSTIFGYGGIWLFGFGILITNHSRLKRHLSVLQSSASALEESENRFYRLFHTMSEGVALHEMIYDRNGDPVDYRIIDVNPSYQEHTGIPASKAKGVLASQLYGIDTPPFIEIYARVARTGEPYMFETSFEPLHKKFQVSVFSPQKGYFATVFQDVSDRKRLEDERLNLERKMLHSQKLESMGILAGGIAHDFNNLLMVTSGNLELAQIELPKDSPVQELIGYAFDATLKATDLTRQMLAYSGKGQFIVKEINLSQMVCDIAKLLQTSISKSIRLDMQLDQNLPHIRADIAQIQQVIMNLVINSSDAIGDKPGMIAIRTMPLEITEDELRQCIGIEKPDPGWFICLEVEDDGCGMDDKTLHSLFDPFFTTKTHGRGLGMSAVLGIIQSHHGAIQVRSEVGKGTLFRILFPEIDIHSDYGLVRRPESEVQHQLNFNGGVVLLIDDEEMVLNLCKSMLERLHFRTILAGDGDEGIKMYKEHRHEISCVILDVTMPGKSGIDVFEEIRAIDPRARIILSSGYSQSDISLRIQGKGITGHLQKPFRFDDLKNEIAHVMSERLSERN
ncbi:MAG: DUF3365 domain-containing protein [bacterium]|nr:DUF3365 domain-containing protein [bacterium]